MKALCELGNYNSNDISRIAQLLLASECDPQDELTKCEEYERLAHIENSNRGYCSSRKRKESAF